MANNTCLHMTYCSFYSIFPVSFLTPLVASADCWCKVFCIGRYINVCNDLAAHAFYVIFADNTEVAAK